MHKLLNDLILSFQGTFIEFLLGIIINALLIFERLVMRSGLHELSRQLFLFQCKIVTLHRCHVLVVRLDLSSIYLSLFKKLFVNRSLAWSFQWLTNVAFHCLGIWPERRLDFHWLINFKLWGLSNWARYLVIYNTATGNFFGNILFAADYCFTSKIWHAVVLRSYILPWILLAAITSSFF